MFDHRELKMMVNALPEKTNADPWRPGKTIKCMDIFEKFQDCIQNMHERNAINLKAKCLQLRNFSILCFKLEPRYFLEATASALDEDAYLDLFLSKQLGGAKKAHVWDFKEHD